jgi:hypothetical protein
MNVDPTPMPQNVNAYYVDFAAAANGEMTRQSIIFPPRRAAVSGRRS